MSPLNRPEAKLNNVCRDTPLASASCSNVSPLAVRRALNTSRRRAGSTSRRATPTDHAQPAQNTVQHLVLSGGQLQTTRPDHGPRRPSAAGQTPLPASIADRDPARPGGGLPGRQTMVRRCAVVRVSDTTRTRGRHNRAVTATQTTLLACTPEAVHGWLTAHDPDGSRRFDGDFRAALDAAATSYDLTPVNDLVRRWRALIGERPQPLTPNEVDQSRRLDLDDDTTGLHQHDAHQ